MDELSPVDISRAAALVLPYYSWDERFTLANVVATAQTIEDIPEPLRADIIRVHNDPSYIPAQER